MVEAAQRLETAGAAEDLGESAVMLVNLKREVKKLVQVLSRIAQVKGTSD